MVLKSRVYLLLVLTIMTAGIGFGYGVLTGGTPHIGAVVGTLIGAGVMGFEMFVVQGPLGAPLRRLPLVLFTLVTTLVWLLVIVAALHLGPRLFHLDAYGEHYTATSFEQDLAFAFGVSLLINAALRVRGLVGPRVLSNVLLGRYYRPLREQRIFMFLDLADSTRLSEQLGDLKVQSLIRHFFDDVAVPVMRYGGETHRYIGDEVVVIWPLTGDVRDQRCVECVFAIRERIERRAAWYERQFGVVPAFRVGLHGGDVVASEVGQDKREIVYFGDTVNTAARLAGACKSTGCDILISRALANRITLPDSVRADAVGALELAGKAQPLDTLALSAD